MKQRFCQACGRDITAQNIRTKYCSVTVYGRKCHDRVNNRRGHFRRRENKKLINGLLFPIDEMLTPFPKEYYMRPDPPHYTGRLFSDNGQPIADKAIFTSSIPDPLDYAQIWKHNKELDAVQSARRFDRIFDQMTTKEFIEVLHKMADNLRSKNVK
jgi:hypothetical protein